MINNDHWKARRDRAALRDRRPIRRDASAAMAGSGGRDVEMGLFGFLKGKGQSLGTAQAAEAPPLKEALVKELHAFGPDRSAVEIDVEPERHRVRIKGHPKDRETREKVILAVGNVEGVAEVEDEAEGPEPRSHTVVAGGSLWGIAEAR
jgi:nucleoid-associated protein YgaU